MHDLHAADKILALALAEAKKNKIKNIKKIVVELGSVIEHGAEILPENIKFNIVALARDTMAAGVQVEVRQSLGTQVKLVEIEGDK
jgi:Zn finger protein HypA/HybF involved in hydrogenase expression